MALYVRALTADEREQLEGLRCAGETDVAKRANIVLLSARKRRVQEISVAVGLHPINVRKWIHRFNELGIAGLYPRRSPGRPRLFDDKQRRAVVELAATDPRELGLDFHSWSLQRLRLQLIARGIVPGISAETIRQELLQGGMVFEGQRWVPRAGVSLR